MGNISDPTIVNINAGKLMRVNDTNFYTVLLINCKNPYMLVKHWEKK